MLCAMRHLGRLASLALLLSWHHAPAVAQSPSAGAAGVVRQSTWPPPGTAGEPITLWPEGVPGQRTDLGGETLADERVANVHEPTITRFGPAAANGTAVIVCPGGGYTRLAIEKEGRVTAEWLNGLGVTVFVLKYRLKEYGHPAPLRDVLRAIRLVRSRAAEWGLAPDRIGVLGFSAGGHLAASAATLFDDPDGRTGAALDATSGRPDFAILIYPVIRLAGPHAHMGSAQNLLGAAAPDRLERYSLDTRVSASTPPTWMVHGGTDTAVVPENSVLFYLALRRAGVPAELLAFEHGPHGIGLQPGFGAMSAWPQRCAEWLRGRGLVR